ncbi:hypothetical protein [Robertmurraya sp. P23]|uniref:hypothetical protein n=1 Tax=Robertmurraya sp. P23 TaxID=3436931 RepID=UPI003D959903
MKRVMRRPFPFGMGNIGGYPNYNPFSQFDSFGYPDAKYYGFEDQVPSKVGIGGSNYSPFIGYGAPSFGHSGYGYPSPYGGPGFTPGFGGGYGLGFGGGPGMGYGGGISPLGAGLLGFGAGLLGGALFDTKGRWYY